MMYTKEILNIEKMINDVLISLGEEPLFLNKNFITYEDLHFSHWVKLLFIKKNSLNITFVLSNGGLRVDIDRAEEIIDISYENLIKNNEITKQILLMIFTSTIMIQYCGEHTTFLYFIKNNTVKKYKYSTTLITICFRKCKEKIYTPIFPEKESKRVSRHL